MFIKKITVVLIAMMALGLAGCSGSESQVQQGNVASQDIIPLIMLVSEQTTGEDASNQQQDALLAHWDLKKGQLSWEKEPLFGRETGSELYSRLVWDGGSKLFACSFGTQQTGGIIKGKMKGFSIEDVRVDSKAIFVPVQGSSRRDEYLQAYTSEPALDSGDSSSDNKLIIKSVQSGNKAKKRELELPDYASQGEIIPLIISGTLESCTLMLLYNNTTDSKNGLAIAELNGKETKWKQMKDQGAGLIAGAGANLAKSGKRIYVTEPEASVIDLSQDQPVIRKFSAGIDIRKEIAGNIAQANDKYGDIYAGEKLGNYGKTLLMSLDLPEEHWVWAFQDEKCVGSLYINNESKNIQVSAGDEKINKDNFGSLVNLFLLPSDGYGQYR